jgi:CheY-like chemotaxis protein
MSQLASLIALALFVIFSSLGAQRIMFNEVMSNSAERLGFSKQTYRIIGAIEIAAGVAMVATVHEGKGGLRVLAIIAAIVLAGMGGGELLTNLRKKQGRRYVLPVAALVAGAVIEAVLRLFH